jgi:S-adenosylmethionine hydrolase
MSTLITLTTDLAGGSYYLGALKGSLYTLDLGINLVDISNEISAFNIKEAAFVLQKAAPYFPSNTVHLLHVNASSGNGQILIAEAMDQYFILFNNGSGPLLFGDLPVKYFRIHQESESGALFLNAIAKAVRSIMDKTYLELPISDVKKSINMQPVARSGYIKGHIIMIDQFQNAITNISNDLILQIFGENRFLISINSYDINIVSKHYSDAKLGDLLAFINNDGLLEIGINNGKAAQLLGLSTSSSVILME